MGRTDFFILNDPELAFLDVLRKHLAIDQPVSANRDQNKPQEDVKFERPEDILRTDKNEIIVKLEKGEGTLKIEKIGVKKDVKVEEEKSSGKQDGENTVTEEKNVVELTLIKNSIKGDEADIEVCKENESRCDMDQDKAENLTQMNLGENERENANKSPDLENTIVEKIIKVEESVDQLDSDISKEINVNDQKPLNDSEEHNLEITPKNCDNPNTDIFEKINVPSDLSVSAVENVETNSQTAVDEKSEIDETIVKDEIKQEKSAETKVLDEDNEKKFTNEQVYEENQDKDVKIAEVSEKPIVPSPVAIKTEDEGNACKQEVSEVSVADKKQNGAQTPDLKTMFPDLEVIHPLSRLAEIDTFVLASKQANSGSGTPDLSEPTVAQLLAQSYQNPIKWPKVVKSNN